MPLTLLSVPPALAEFMARPAGRRQWAGRLAELSPEGLFVGADPRGRRLGSGGGTVHLLHAAWRAANPLKRVHLADWLAQEQRLVLHAGGESRRLPAYAGIGKAFLPLPALARAGEWRFDQRLMDLQLPTYRQVLTEAGPKAAVLVTSGDVWLDFNPLEIPPLTGDIVGIGMRVAPEVAQHFGVYFVSKAPTRGGTREQPIAFFVQKPTPAEIYRHLEHHDCFVDTGMWLLSVEAVRLLFLTCGWDDRRQAFRTKDGLPAKLDLYTEIGAVLGRSAQPPAALRRLGWGRLQTAVVPLAAQSAHFYHLGSSRQVFESIEQIQQGRFGPARQLCMASNPACATRGSTLAVWLDGVAAGGPLLTAGHNMVTGLPAGSRLTRLGPEWCLEVAPVGRDEFVVRPYHLDDPLRGQPGAGARICGQDAALWLADRKLPAPAADVFDLPLYPILRAAEIDQALLDWFFSPTVDPAQSARLAATRRVAASAIPDAIHYGRLFAARSAGYAGALLADFQACLSGADTRVFQQDFAAIASFCRQEAPGLRRWLLARHEEILARLSLPTLRSRLLILLAELSRGRAAQSFQAAGYRQLQASIIGPEQLPRSRPALALKEDQIVWARSPVRLDLAGGWTDTPPYCLEQGGAVLNVAVLLNGQPPIQVFIRPVPERRFRLRSIDLGSTEDLTTYADVSGFRDPHSGFSLARAALALAGFHPDFWAGKPARSLAEQLAGFGGGLEISLLSAVPKGSGLGTSSILGATLLGALNRACGLGWDDVDIYHRVLGMEQLLTTGGGWQDQAGALFRSAKLVQTQPGPEQTPTVRYLPEHLLGAGYANQTLLLYYTGTTRLAKNILNEIVRDMFLSRSSTLRTLTFIRANALLLHQAMQEGSPAALHRCIARSWALNCELDAGTSTPEIAGIIATGGPDLVACKLLGAGGGGYMLLCARDPAAGQRIRHALEVSPPNRRARFIDFQVSERGLEVTVS